MAVPLYSNSIRIRLGSCFLPRRGYVLMHFRLFIDYLLLSVYANSRGLYYNVVPRNIIIRIARIVFYQHTTRYLGVHFDTTRNYIFRDC